MKAIIKKSIIIWLVTISAVYYKANAQITIICNQPCTVGPLKTKVIELCKFTNTIDLPDGTNVTLNDAPFVMVFIQYREKICNGDTSIVIEDYIYLENSNYWNFVHFQILQGLNPLTNPIIPTSYLSSCIYYPANPTNISNAITEALNQFANSFPPGTAASNGYDFYFNGGCYSLVRLQFPSGSYFLTTPDDLGYSDTIYLSAASIIAQPIPCNDICCKVTYGWRVVTTINNETISKWVPISAAGPGIGDCESQPLPDYNSYNPKFEAFDPLTNQNITGTVLSQTPCEPKCPKFLNPPPPWDSNPLTSVTTDKIHNNDNIQLSASPIPFNNFIKFASNKRINKIIVYDIKGRKVMNVSKIENDEINTSHLKEGVYFIQVYFEGNNIKTLKVIKE